MLILHIETSTSVCSVALSENGVCLLQKINAEGQNHAKLLSLFIDEILTLVKKEGKKIDAVSISQGPGSYTGLRIGTATAKGLCYGMDIPLIAIDTLQIMAHGAMRTEQIPENALLCPMIDARRMEVYNAFYTAKLERVGNVEATIVDENTFADQLQANAIYFCGNGADKCQHIILHENARFVAGINPEAIDMIALAEAKYAAKDFADIAYFDPFYLKEFQATVSKKNLF